MMNRRQDLDPAEILTVTAGDRARLTALAAELAAEAGSRPSGAQLAELGAAVATGLPSDLARAAHRYRAAGSPHDVLLLRGLLPDPDGLDPTPATATPDALGPAAQAAALVLLGVLSLLGEPFTFRSLYGGRLVQHVTPAPGQQDAQTAEGSEAFLDWHVEDAHTDDRADHVGLLCLRADPAATTLVAPVRATTLEPRWIRVLRQPRFTVVPDVAHGSAPAAPGPAVPVLAGDPADLEVRLDAVYLRPLPGDTDAGVALAHLDGALQAAALGHVLAPGDLLILDNRRVVHARTGFAPRFDGRDRWLLRAMTCGSPRAHRRRGGHHAL